MAPEAFLRRLASSGISHQLEPPLGDVELQQWRAAHPDLLLPSDLVDLLRRANGFQVDLRGGAGGYLSLIPLRDYGPVRLALYGEHVDEAPSNAYLKTEWPDHCLAISRDADGTNLVTLDAKTGSYLEADAYDTPRVIGKQLPALLDWLDEHWLKPLVGSAN